MCNNARRIWGFCCGCFCVFLQVRRRIAQLQITQKPLRNERTSKVYLLVVNDLLSVCVSPNTFYSRIRKYVYISR